MNGRNLSLDDRGRRTTALAAKVIRRAEAAKAKVISATNLQDDSRAKRTPPPTRAKTRGTAPVKTEDSQVGCSIKKLLSVYEKEKTPEAKALPKLTEEKRANARPSRYGLTRAPSRASEEAKEKPKVIRLESPPKKQPPKKKVTPENAKIARKPSTPLAAAKAPDEVVRKSTEPKELVPVAVRERPENLLDSLINNCLEERPRKRTDLDVLLATGTGGFFPVCSKRAIDDIPSALSEDKRDLIIMLRRRNSEPYSPKSAHESAPWGLDCDRIYLLQSGLEDRLKPYWNVSLFRANRSLSVLDSESGSGILSIAAPSESLLPSGQFGFGCTPRPETGVGVASFPETPQSGPRQQRWLPEIAHCGGSPSVAPLVTLLDRETSLPKEPAPVKVSASFSKDDLCQPTARLRIIVKRSQKKLVAAQSAPNASVNKKTHKLTKLRRASGSEMRATIWHKHILFTVTSAVVLVTGGFLFFLYFLTKSPAYFNLTPPIPGLVRGC